MNERLNDWKLSPWAIQFAAATADNQSDIPTGPYVGWGVDCPGDKYCGSDCNCFYPPMESDVCQCESKLCTDCGPVWKPKAEKPEIDLDNGLIWVGHAYFSLNRLWLTYYKTVRWIKRLVAR